MCYDVLECLLYDKLASCGRLLVNMISFCYNSVNKQTNVINEKISGRILLCLSLFWCFDIALIILTTLSLYSVLCIVQVLLTCRRMKHA